MPNRSTAIDPGSSTVKVLTAAIGKTGVSVLRFASVPAGDAAALASTGISLKNAVAGLAGRDMNLRPTQVPPSPDWQLRNLMELEIADLAGQSGGELSADYNLLPVQDEESGMDIVLMALARNEALERVAGEVAGAGGSIGAHVPNCIALYNAFLRCGPVEEDATVCLLNVGRETTDVAIVRGTDLLTARNLAVGTKVFDDAIAGAFNVSARKAESLKKDLLDLDPESRGRYASGQAEKVTVAAGGASNAIVSAVQSSMAFCRAQTKIADLQLDKVLVCGGGARTRGLRGMLREAVRCPVELFDPFEYADTSSLPADEAAALDAARPEAAVALGLALTTLDPELYSIEILPEAVKARKRFLEQTIWNVLAGAVAAGLLVMAYVQGGERAQQLDSASRAIKSQEQRLKNTHNEADRVAAENTVLRQRVDYLSQRAVPLHGTLSTLRALQETLPEEFWLQTLEVQRRGQRAGEERATAIVLAGAGKEVSGADLDGLYTRFNSALRERLPVRSGATQDLGGQIKFTIPIEFRASSPEEGK